MDQPGLVAVQRLTLSPESAAHFGKNDTAFKSLIDAVAAGDYHATVKACEDGGISEKQASSLVRDSAALASAMLSIGDAMGW